MDCKHELPGWLQLSNAEQNMSFDSHTDLGTRVSEVNALGLVTLVLYSFVSW